MDREQVQLGRRTEMEKMLQHGVCELKPLSELRGKKIGVKWVEEMRRRPDGAEFARCRLVSLRCSRRPLGHDRR